MYEGEIMNFLNEQLVLDYYLSLMDEGKIDFLLKYSSKHDLIKEHILVLRNEKSMNKKIQSAKELWKILFACSMSHIDPNQNGYDELFKYFDEYVEFEELIFASDSFYRDHTIHCLWVYFLGVYLKFHDEFSDLIKVNHLHENHLNFITELYEYKKNVEDADTVSMIESVIDIIKIDMKNDQSVFCISALTHDLGYPLKKIAKINKSIKKVLPGFGIDKFDEFEFNYSAIQQHFNEKFLNLLTTTFEHTIALDDPKSTFATPEDMDKIFFKDTTGQGAINLDELRKLNEETYNNICNAFKFTMAENINYPLELRYSNDLEKYQHGIMSAFLLVKVVDAFRNMELVVNADKSSMNKIPFKNFGRFLTKQHILRAITDHTSDGYKISSIKGPSEFLTFIDELEEFSRISRANQNREFINEFCTTAIYREHGYLMIDFIFDNQDIGNLDPELAFKGRCKKLLTLFDLEQLDEDLKIKLSCIGNLPYDNNHYTIEIRNKFAKITINKEEKEIPKYLKSMNFMTREGYESL